MAPHRQTMDSIEYSCVHCGRLRVAKINVDTNPHTAARYRVQSIPALKLFSDDWLLYEIKGALPKASLDAAIDPHL